MNQEVTYKDVGNINITNVDSQLFVILKIKEKNFARKKI